MSASALSTRARACGNSLRRSSDQFRPRLSRAGVLRAQEEGRNGGSTDWDAAWRSFHKQVTSQVDTQPMTVQQVRRPAPRNSAEQLRRQERVLLDLWTSEDALKWGSLALVAGLMVVILSAGAPVDDGRCTLPWC